MEGFENISLGSVWMVSGAAGPRREDAADARDVRNAGPSKRAELTAFLSPQEGYRSYGGAPSITKESLTG